MSTTSIDHFYNNEIYGMSTTSNDQFYNNEISSMSTQLASVMSIIMKYLAYQLAWVMFIIMTFLGRQHNQHTGTWCDNFALFTSLINLLMMYPLPVYPLLFHVDCLIFHTP